VAFNCYFLVPTGRGARLSDLDARGYEEVLEELVRHHTTYLGRMMVRAKCAPHFMRVLHRQTPDSPVLNYQTRCPCGTQYCRITPDGKLTPCPYLPEVAGDLRRESFGEIWRHAALFQELRAGSLGGRCGRCEYRELCGGCRARAFATGGDYLGEDPSCVHEPAAAAEVIRVNRPASYGDPARPALRWTPEARARMQRIPSFVRGVVVRRLEDYARAQGRDEVSSELLREVRERMPIDFSKRRPFFLDDA
jgi:radical SAM protein with 4Fe4S-binding SPASM domain